MKKSLIALAVMAAAGAAAGGARRRFDGPSGHELRALDAGGLMASFYSTELTTINGPQYGNAPATRVKANKQGGRIRIFEATYTVPVGGLAIADKIIWGKLPVRARVLGHLGLVSFSAGTAASTLNLGDNASAARHLAATAINAAGSAVPSVQSASGASFETSDDTASVANSFVSATDDCTLISVVAGAGMPAGQIVTVRIPYVCD